MERGGATVADERGSRKANSGCVGKQVGWLVGRRYV